MSPPPLPLYQKRPIQPEEKAYALEKANESLGHKPANGLQTEIFIVIAVMTTLWLALKDC